MRKLTGWLIIGVAVALGIYDIYALTAGGAEATISVVIRQAALKNPAIPFAAGFLCGHFFWRIKSDDA